uniref:Putative translation initiation factor 3 subunit b eif-3b n=1 Tax=Ixodes ricinus TaxID=34613 RepID=V5IC96_IXORI
MKIFRRNGRSLSLSPMSTMATCVSGCKTRTALTSSASCTVVERKVAVYLNSNPEPTVVKDRERWTDNLVMWSPLGTYLATFHQQGIALWGGPQYNQIMRFTHFGVKFIDFSPCENYLVTLSPPSPDTFHQPQRGGAGGPGGPEEAQVVIIWDIRTGMKRRSFTADPEMHTWPMFKWSSDDRFFARPHSGHAEHLRNDPPFGLLDNEVPSRCPASGTSRGPRCRTSWLTGWRRTRMCRPGLP